MLKTVAGATAFSLLLSQAAHAQGSPPAMFDGFSVIEDISISVAVPSVNLATSQRRGDGGINAFMQDYALVARGVDFSQKSDAMIDEEAAAYRAAVERLAGTTYNSVPAPMRQSNEMQARLHFQQQADNIDDEIEWASLRVSRNGGTVERMPTIAYNRILAIGIEMDAAVRLFPGEAAFVEGKSKADAWLAKFGSRDDAADVFEAEAVAAAESVEMPPASTRDVNLERMFQTAWATSGIDREIMVIHPRGGWGVKRDSLGRVIGQTHDAAIAARNPARDDQCYLYDFTMLKVEGGGVRRSSHSTRRIACKNVPS